MPGDRIANVNPYRVFRRLIVGFRRVASFSGAFQESNCSYFQRIQIPSNEFNNAGSSFMFTHKLFFDADEGPNGLKLSDRGWRERT